MVNHSTAFVRKRAVRKNISNRSGGLFVRDEICWGCRVDEREVPMIVNLVVLCGVVQLGRLDVVGVYYGGNIN